MSYLKRLLSANEEILFATRPHWTAFAGRVWLMVLLFLLAAIAAVAINLGVNGYVSTLTSNQRWALRVGAFVVLLAYPLGSLVVRYIRWRAEQYVVSNLRVIQLRGILSKRVLDSSLEKVNDVVLEQSFVGRLLDYGNIEILTASELAVNNFRRVARPIAFKTAMLNAKQDLEGGGRDWREDTTKLLGDLARLRDQGVLTDEEFLAKKAKLLGEL